MDPDLQFPNPVERHDLPVPRKKWKYVLAGGLTLLLLGTIFLPQILSSKVGRNLLKAYLENQYRGQAWMTDFKTSWWGPTTLTKFSLTDPEGRQIRFDRLESPISLWGLLFGKVDLGEATIDKLYAEFVIDYGDGTDSIDRLPASFNPGATSAIAPAGGATAAMPQLPNVSGKIKLTNAQFILTRGQILQNAGFRTVYRSMRFVVPEGRVEIASLDRPWTCQLDGTIGADDNPGAFSLDGTLDLGEDGRLNWAKASADLTVSMRNVPNVATAETGSIGWLLFPVVSAEDYQQAFGSAVQWIELHVKGEEGDWRFEKLEAVGQGADGRESRISGKPIVNLAARPRMIEIDEPVTVSVLLTPDVAAYLSYVNPFFRDAVPGRGRVEMKVESAAVAVRPGYKQGKVTGQVSARDVVLASGQVMDSDAWPKELVTQWQAVTGDLSPGPVMQMPGAKFAVQNAVVKTEPYEVTIDELPVKLDVTVALAGNALSTTAQLGTGRETGAASVNAQIAGTLEKPSLKANSVPTELAAAMDRTMLQLRQRKSERLMEVSNKRVEGLLEVYDRMSKRAQGASASGK